MRRVLLIFFTLSALHSRAAFAQDMQPCDGILMQEALQERLGVDLQPQTQGNVIAWTCKNHPKNSRLMVAAIFYHLPPGSSPDIGFVLALIDTRTRTVKSSYQETLEEDAGTRIGSNSLRLDMGRYQLAPGVRALGVRMNIGYSPACADGGTSDFLSLFIAQEQHLKPVLKELPMSQWKRTSGRPLGCVLESKGDTQDEAQMTLAIAPTRSHGLNDLYITAFIQPRANGEVDDKVFAMQKPKQIRGTLRFDGTSYRTDAWDKALEKQWPWVLAP